MPKPQDHDIQTTNSYTMFLKKPHWLSITLVLVAAGLLIAGIVILRKGRLGSNSVADIAITPEGELWAISSDGVSKFDGQIWTTYNESDGVLLSKYVKGGEDIDVTQDGTIWVVTHGGVSKFDGDNWISYIEFDKYEEKMPMAVEASGAVWLVLDEGIARFHNSIWTTYTEANGLPSNYVRDIVTSGNILWVATSRGLSRFDGVTWTNYTEKDGLTNEKIASIAVSPDGSVWLSSWEPDAQRFDDSTWTTYKLEKQEKTGIAKEISSGANGVCISGRIGVDCFDGESWTNFRPENRLVSNFLEGGIALAPDGSFWVANYHAGLLHFDGQNWTSYTEYDGLPLGIGLIILSLILLTGTGIRARIQNKSRQKLTDYSKDQVMGLENAIPKNPASLTGTTMIRDKTEIQAARKWYRWLWLSPLLTFPTVVLIMTAGHYQIFQLVCPQGWNNCDLDAVFRLKGLIAVGISALWHLVLLIPSMNKESQFVRWHGRQEMIIASVRTIVPLIFVLAAGASGLNIVALLILIPIWIFGTLWGQRQAARGDCTLMRWTGRTDSLPGPPADEEVDGIGGLSTETLESTFRFSKDPQERQAALEEMKKRGLVELEG
jgi:hypothetical protein